MSSDQVQGKYADKHEDFAYLKKDDKTQKKCHQTTRVNTLHHTLSRLQKITNIIYYFYQ